MSEPTINPTSENNPPDKFKELLEKNKSGLPPDPVKRGRGRPPKQSGDKQTEKVSQEAVSVVKPVPPPKEDIAFACLIRAGVNGILKPKYPEMELSEEEAKRLSVPYFQLYQYYLPDVNGIGAVWANAIVQTASIVIAKIQIAKEILKNEKPTDTQPAERTEGNINTGHQGDG